MNSIIIKYSCHRCGVPFEVYIPVLVAEKVSCPICCKKDQVERRYV